MSRFFTLTHMLIKNGLNSSDKNRKKQILFIVIMILVFAPTLIPFCIGYAGLYASLKVMGQEGVALVLLTGACATIIFFFGIFYIINAFYFSKDIDNLIPLPLRPYEILGGKFLAVTAYEYMLELFILLPFLVVHGIMSGGGILFYIYAAIIFLLTPVIPLVMASIIDMIIMRFINVSRHKDMMRTIGGIIAIAFGFGINFAMRQTQDIEKVKKVFLEGNNSAVGILSKVFPGINLQARCLINSNNLKGLLYLLAFIAFCALAAALFLAIGEAFYIKGAIGGSESASKKKKLSDQQIDKEMKSSSVMKSFVMKEIRILFRTPAYFINCVLMNFMWPLIMLFILFSNDKGGIKDLSISQNIYKNSVLCGIILTVGFAIIAFIVISNPIATTAISREGTSIFVNKYLPIDYNTQIIAKVLSSIIINLIGVVTLMLAFIIIARPPVLLVLGIAISGFIGMLFCSFTGIFIDLNFPKLLWDNENRAVKQNMNVLLNMLVCGVIIAITTAVSIILRLNVYAAFIFIVLVYGILGTLMYYLLSTEGVKLLKKIEV